MIQLRKEIEMSFKPVYRCSCDSPRCDQESWEEHRTKQDCVLPEGWMQVRGKHYCPDCGPMYEQPKFVEQEREDHQAAHQ